MAKRKLTAARCNGAAYPERKGPNGQYILWDHKVTGLGLRVNPSGAKVWVLRYVDAARKRRVVVLGPYGQAKDQLNIGRARNLADDKRAELRRGADPLLQKEALELPFGDLCDLWLEEWAKPRLKRWRNDKYRIDRRLKPALGKAPASALPRDAVLNLHTEIGAGEGKPVEANRTLSLIGRIIEWGRDAGRVGEDAPNPARRLRKRQFPEEFKTNRTLSLAELPALRSAIEARRNATSRAAFWLLLLTALRKMELFTLTWDRVNLDDESARLRSGLDLPRRAIYIPPELNKTGRDFIAPLSTAASRILAELKRTRDDDSDAVFTGWGKRGCLIDPHGAWRRVRADLERPDLTVHDLRATAATLARNRGEDIGVISRMLNHRAAGPVITQRYLDELPFDRVRQAFERHAEEVVKTAGVKDPLALVWPEPVDQAGKVVPFVGGAN